MKVGSIDKLHIFCVRTRRSSQELKKVEAVTVVGQYWRYTPGEGGRGRRGRGREGVEESEKDKGRERERGWRWARRGDGKG